MFESKSMRHHHKANCGVKERSVASICKFASNPDAASIHEAISVCEALSTMIQSQSVSQPQSIRQSQPDSDLIHKATFIYD